MPARATDHDLIIADVAIARLGFPQNVFTIRYGNIQSSQAWAPPVGYRDEAQSGIVERKTRLPGGIGLYREVRTLSPECSQRFRIITL